MSLPVSCLMPTADRPEFVRRAIALFQAQDHPERELLIVDDGTRSIADLVPDDPRIRYLRIAPGRTLGAKRNLCVQEAAHELVMHWDDDDWMAPTRLSAQVAALVAAGAEVCGMDRLLFHHAGDHTTWLYRYGRGNPRRWLAGNTLLYTKDFWRSSPFPDVQVGSDTLFVWARSLDGAAVVDDLSLYVATIHPDNTSPKPLVAPNWSRHELSAAPAFECRELPALCGPPRQAQARPVPAATPPGSPWCVAITTYESPELLEWLLDDLERECPAEGLDVRVYDDGSSAAAYTGLRRRLARRGWHYLRAPRNHGKQEWWRWWTTILADLRTTSAERFAVLQDDMRLCSRFFDRVGELWSALAADRRASLFLHLDEYGAAQGRPGWTPVVARPAGPVVECGWLDLNAFVADRRTFDALRWRTDPVDARRWQLDPHLGSGVGQQLSSRLHAAGLRMYRVAESLTVHRPVPSRMNPRARESFPMRTIRFVDGPARQAELSDPRKHVVASLASVPARERGLAAVVEALLPQVDRLCVHLDGHERVPAFLADPRIALTRGRIGDAGKFEWAGESAGYVLTCDDDLRYPPDYAAELVAGIERYDRAAVVGFHGSILHTPLLDHLRSRRLLHFSQGVEHDTAVHVLGTGVCGYHASALDLRPEDFPVPNAADPQFALAARRRGVPLVCLRHKAGWLQDHPEYRAESLYATALRDDRGRERVTALLREHAWPTPVLPDSARPGSARPGSARPGPALPDSVGGPPGTVPVDVAGPTTTARLHLPDGDHITLAVLRTGTYYERDLLDAIHARRPRGTFVDVGAHYGNHTVFFAVECGAAHVVAVEPHPAHAAGLRANVLANGVGDRVTVLEAAAHPELDAVEPVELPWRPRAGSAARSNSGRSTVRAAAGPGVPAAGLDQLLADRTGIAVIKIDVEDMGLEVLASGLGLIARDRPLVAVEAAAQGDADRMRALFAGLDYELVGRFCWTPTWLWSPRTPSAVRQGRPTTGA